MIKKIGQLLDDSNHRYMALAFFDSLAYERQVDVLPYEEKFITIMRSDSNASSLVSGVLVKLVADDQVTLTR